MTSTKPLPAGSSSATTIKLGWCTGIAPAPLPSQGRMQTFTLTPPLNCDGWDFHPLTGNRRVPYSVGEQARQVKLEPPPGNAPGSQVYETCVSLTTPWGQIPGSLAQSPTKRLSNTDPGQPRITGPV